MKDNKLGVGKESENTKLFKLLYNFMAKSKFLKVKCKCGNEQLVFNKASTEVKCLKCKKPLTKPTGGKTEILAEVIENYE